MDAAGRRRPRSGKKSGKKSRPVRRESRGFHPLPKTAKVASRRSGRADRPKQSKANINMSLAELQIMAKSRGIPFGELSKTKLVQKINNYY